jgi:hypothetical protein
MHNVQINKMQKFVKLTLYFLNIIGSAFKCTRGKYILKCRCLLLKQKCKYHAVSLNPIRPCCDRMQGS